MPGLHRHERRPSGSYPHFSGDTVLLAAVPPILLKSPNNPEGLPIEVFDSLRRCPRARWISSGSGVCRPASRTRTTASRPFQKPTSPNTSRSSTSRPWSCTRPGDEEDTACSPNGNKRIKVHQPPIRRTRSSGIPLGTGLSPQRGFLKSGNTWRLAHTRRARCQPFTPKQS